MSHLRLVPQPVETAPAPAATRAADQRPMGSAWDDPKVVALQFFQSASGLCLCRACSMRRHPAYGNL